LWHGLFVSARRNQKRARHRQRKKKFHRFAFDEFTPVLIHIQHTHNR
jgi:hypothetical protein